MASIINNYVTNTVFMVIILAMIFARTTSMSAIQASTHRSCQRLIGMTGAYVLADSAFIAVSLTEGLPSWLFPTVVFIFYVVYTLLPFFWFLFVRSFVGSTFTRLTHRLELIPIIILMLMILATPFTGVLWSFSPEGTYVRGGLFTFYSYLNLFYYILPFIYAAVIVFRKNQKNEPYMAQAAMISAVPLLAMAINSLVIPVYQVFPFMPFTSVLVALLAYFFMFARESDLMQNKHRDEIQAALDQAQEASARAIEASKVKSTFLSNMSHDIRTPMNAIINLTEIALAEDDITVIKDHLDKINVSGKFLLGLINDILDMSKIENGDIELHNENLTRSEFIQTVETVINPLMDARHIHFHPELSPGEYTISVDKLRFNQIFFNLLSNAAKFTPEGGDVWFEVTNLETHDGKLKIKFVVRDNGIGMSEEFLEHLYEPFAREQSELSNKTRGTGLGLPIVKSLVEAMGGTISVKSKLGEGTEFVVVVDVDIVSRDEQTAAPTVHEQTIEGLEGMRILLVEDNEINTYVAQLILDKVGCVTTSVDNGQKAVDAYNASEPYSIEAILMDVRMPVMDGIEATKIIRASDRPDAKTIPIIAMTADAFDDERKKTLESGMNYHLSKPVDAQKIYEVLKECRNKLAQK